MTEMLTNAVLDDLPKKDPWMERQCLRLRHGTALKQDIFSPGWKNQTLRYRQLLEPLEHAVVSGRLADQKPVRGDGLFADILKEPVNAVIYLAGPETMHALAPLRTVGDVLEAYYTFYNGSPESESDRHLWAFGRFCFWLKFMKDVPDVAWFQIAVLAYLLSFLQTGESKDAGKDGVRRRRGYMPVPVN